MKKAFIPPQTSNFYYGLAGLLKGPIIKVLQNITSIHIKPEDLEKLKQLENERIIFFGNHPTTAEPPLVVYLADQFKEKYHFLGSRQIFEWGGGVIGYFLPKFGAYSVIAGIADRESVKTTRNILAQEKARLVIFPEGEPTSGENDSLMPFQPGIGQLGFWGLEDARKKDPDAEIYIVPMFWRYKIDAPQEKITQNIEKRLLKLEKKMGIEAGDRGMLRRFLQIGRVLIEQYEKELGIIPDDPEDFNFRTGRVRHALLDNVAKIYNVKNYHEEENAIMKFRQLFPITELMMIDYQGADLPKLTKAQKKKAFYDLIHAFEFIVIKRDHLIERPTPERAFEWLERYESLILGTKPRALGGVPTKLPRQAHLFLGDISKLSDYYPEKRNLKKQSIERLNIDLRAELEGLVKDSEYLNQPMPVEEDPLA